MRCWYSSRNEILKTTGYTYLARTFSRALVLLVGLISKKAREGAEFVTDLYLKEY